MPRKLEETERVALKKHSKLLPLQKLGIRFVDHNRASHLVKGNLTQRGHEVNSVQTQEDRRKENIWRNAISRRNIVTDKPTAFQGLLNAIKDPLEYTDWGFGVAHREDLLRLHEAI